MRGEKRERERDTAREKGRGWVVVAPDAIVVAVDQGGRAGVGVGVDAVRPTEAMARIRFGGISVDGDG